MSTGVNILSLNQFCVQLLYFRVFHITLFSFGDVFSWNRRGQHASPSRRLLIPKPDFWTEVVKTWQASCLPPSGQTAALKPETLVWGGGGCYFSLPCPRLLIINKKEGNHWGDPLLTESVVANLGNERSLGGLVLL